MITTLSNRMIVNELTLPEKAKYKHMCKALEGIEPSLKIISHINSMLHYHYAIMPLFRCLCVQLFI